MTKEEMIDRLWVQSSHGTQREDIEAAYNAGAAANQAAISDLLDRIETAEKARDELLEALKWMVLRTEEGGYPDGKCLEEARAAIAKATGEQP